MKAQVLEAFGSPGDLRLRDVDMPSPGPGEVLIRVRAAGLNPVDWKIMEGGLARLFPCKFPLIPGWDAAGTVAALGNGVSGFDLGQRVWAFCRKPDIQWGTYAEYVVMDAAAVAPMPENADFAQASSVPLAGLTAWQSLFDLASIRPGQTVLIHAAAGGVGGFAVPMAKWAGARVIATARLGNHDYVRSLGADLVIDYSTQDFATALRAQVPDGVDVALGTVGGEVLARSYEVVRPGGLLLSVTDKADKTLAERLGISAKFLLVRPDGPQLRRLAGLVDSGTLPLPELTEMPLSDAPLALERSKSGHLRGKIALMVD